MLMYVHLPPYESKGAAVRLAVNRCLFGLGIMQLTMTGLLALKTTDDGGKHRGVWDSPLQPDNQPPPWSDYAKMVASIAPLLAITMFTYGWLNEGYTKQVTNIPLDILGKVAMEQSDDNQQFTVSASQGLNSIATTGPHPSAGNLPDPRGLSSLRHTHGRELNDLGIRRHNSSHRGSMHDPLSLQSAKPPAAPNSRTSGVTISTISMSLPPALSIPDLEQPWADVPAASADPTTMHAVAITTGSIASSPVHGSQVSTSLPTNLPSNIIIRKQSSISLQTGRSLFDETGHEPSPFDEPADDLDTSDAQSETSETARLIPDLESATSNNHAAGARGGFASSSANGAPTDTEERIPLSVHLEPPMTRVPGVLDAPVEAASSVLRYCDDETFGASATSPTRVADPSEESWLNDDMQMHTYIHPALIGKLPMAWLSERHQPSRLVEMREEQARGQREAWRRLVAKQRVGVQFASVENQIGEPVDAWAEPAGQRYGSGFMARGGDGTQSAAGAAGSAAATTAASTAVPRGLADVGAAPIIGRIRSFVDGFTSWVHLTMS
eukprot:jgi/Hompol1/812/HPOL_001782-RA